MSVRFQPLHHYLRSEWHGASGPWWFTVAFDGYHADGDPSGIWGIFCGWSWGVWWPMQRRVQASWALWGKPEWRTWS